jgi:hypothetical protein
MDKRLIFGLINILIFASCATDKTGFIVRHKKKNITLTSIHDQHKIGYETDSAIIYIGQNDAIMQTEKLLSNRKLNSRFDHSLTNDLKTNLDSLEHIQSDIVLQNWKNQKDSIDLKSYYFEGFIDQWILQDLILKGKAEIWNKSNKRFEKQITYHFVRDQLGGESCFYTFKNGTEFYRQILGLGE